MTSDSVGAQRLIEITADLTAAYVSNNHVAPGELGSLVGTIHAALASLGSPRAESPAASNLPTPAAIRKSITPSHLISFEDGKPYKTLRRHLTTKGLTPETYRAKWGLPSDYPVVSKDYSEARSRLAVGLGLGRRPNEAPAAPEPAQAVPARGGKASDAKSGTAKSDTAQQEAPRTPKAGKASKAAKDPAAAQEATPAEKAPAKAAAKRVGRADPSISEKSVAARGPRARKAA